MGKRGLYIVFEGIDGSGKTTLMHMFSQEIFNRYRVPSLLTLEPTYVTPSGIELRARLKEDKDPKANKEKYFKLFVQDRGEHLELVVGPSLNNGVWVIQDRGALSTAAYQGMQGVSLEDVIAAHQGFVKPNLIVYVDVPPEIAFERIRERSQGQVEKFERLDALIGIYNHYKEAINQINEFLSSDGELIVVNNTGSLEEAFQHLLRSFEDYIERKGQNFFLGARE